MRRLGQIGYAGKGFAYAIVGLLVFDAAVTMGCGDECPLVLAKRRVDWQIPDPKNLPPEDFRRIRDLIESKVVELLKELSPDGKATPCS